MENSNQPTDTGYLQKLTDYHLHSTLNSLSTYLQLSALKNFCHVKWISGRFLRPICWCHRVTDNTENNMNVPKLVKNRWKLTVQDRIQCSQWWLRNRWTLDKMQIIPWLVGQALSWPTALGRGRSSPISIVLSRQQAYTTALQLGALDDVGGRLHLSCAICCLPP